MTSHKSKLSSHLMLLLAAAFVLAVGIYFWRKKSAGAPICKEICFSTGEEASCDVVCVQPDAPAE